jgi:hypothetical protein
MSEKPHAQLQTYHRFGTQIAQMMSSAAGLPEGITLQDGVLLDVSPEVTDQGIAEVAVRLGEYDMKHSFQQVLVRYNFGRMIMELSARMERSIDEVIDDTGIAGRLGLEVKTLSNWTRVARNIPPHLLIPGITWSHLTAVDVRLPDDSTKVMEIRGIQEKLLREASENPVENTTQETRKKMHEALEDGGHKPLPPPDKFEILLKYALMLRKLRVMDETGDDSRVRIDLVDAIEASENQLILLQVISETV